MPIELKRESVQVNEILCREKHSSEAYTYIIVPDSKPDIKKVLSVSANAVVKEKYTQKDRITVSGNIDYKILYLGDDETGSVKSIYYDTPFSQQINVPGADDGVRSSIVASVSDVVCNIENSRKISVQTKIDLSCNISNPNDIDFVTEIDTDKVVPYKAETVEVFNEVISQHDSILIGDTVSIGQGMPMIEEMLKVDASLTKKDTKIVNNKLVIKGVMTICAMYADADVQLQVLNQDIPFTEIVDVSGISDDMVCDISYRIDSLAYQVAEDNDGDRTLIDFDVEISVDTVAYECSDLDVISDMYSPEADIKIHTKDTRICSLVGNDFSNVDVAGSISLPVDAPDISRIYNVTVTPEITGVSVADGKMYVEGNFNTYAEYISDVGDCPVNTVSKSIPFTQKTNISSIPGDTLPGVTVSVDEISYDAAKSREINVRILAGISSRLTETCAKKVISKIDVEEDLPEFLMPSIVIYFVQSGDTLWNIAKRYRTTVDDIADINDIDPEDMLMPNQKLLIPKRD